MVAANHSSSSDTRPTRPESDCDCGGNTKTPASGILRIWRWASHQTVLALIPLIVAGIYTFAAWDTEVKAQSEQLKVEREHVNQALAEVRVRHQEFREELLFHLGTLRESVERGNEDASKKMEVIEGGLRSLNTDMAIVCTKVAGNCRLGRDPK